MTRRQGEWHLLGHDSDPVPGSWTEIEDEAARITGIAETIADQVTRLRRIAEDDQILRGEYADGLRDSCGSLADDLGRVQGRFEAVGEELEGWWDPVKTARTATWNALQDAEAAQAVIDANPEPGPPLPGAPAPTDDQETAEQIRAGKHSGAVTDLSAARTAFSTAMDAYEDKAGRVARAIRDACDDDFKDSRWDTFKNWVDANADWLKKIADIISIIVTVVAVIALFCTPAGWIIALVAGLALLGLGIRFALAASGNGSWTDFALDLVGILTLGTGKIATSLAKLGRGMTLKRVAPVAGNLARTKAVTAARSAFANATLRHKPMVWLTRSNPLSRWMAGRSAYTTEKLAWLTKELPTSKPLQGLRSGLDMEAAALRTELDDIAARFGPGLVDGLHGGATTVAENVARIGTGIDFTDTILGDNTAVDYDGVGPYSDLKDQWTYGPGGHLR
ncbi:hypothetical protein HMPREF0063_12318 [Aeromicrobium marinum DSM 15272]|uniref:WXG100 family type VII secretion target n=1 Tax=Aeromicrobium marinum DSM 15272 TaxID=585531 RepID=E2SD06_9ACTN|nr:hypothetical protein [Aeromicrobium marinum]EFQ83109.1 hypothetical protein HMPREF0063_12318 [Aeromicrobium marinum DSM 15272]